MLELSKGNQLAERYTLERRLGGGGEAQTWLAKDRLTRASVALKIVSPDPPQVARLRAEWQIGIRLMHAHIARAFEFHSETEASFFSQQFIDGPDIQALASLSPEASLPPMGLVADALRFMHSKGLVHRDVKASNILLDHNGAPYLTDFGVTAAIGKRANGGSTIAMSPESMSGLPASPADDIFALGGLIYELLAGFSAYSAVDTVADIQHKVPQTLRAANGDPLPAALVDLVARMLEKDARYRPDATEVVEQLRAAGFAPGITSIKIGRHAGSDDQLESVVESIRPVKPAVMTKSTAAVSEASGISRMTVAVGFGVLLLALIAVFFVLPNRVHDNDKPLAEQRAKNDTTDAVAISVDEAGSDDTASQSRRQNADLPVRTLDGEEISFSENKADYSGLDAQGRARFNAESTLGELLSSLEVLEGRGAHRWAPVEYRKAKELYDAGDKEYLDREFVRAEKNYVAAITALEPLYDRIEPTFEKAYADATKAFEDGDRLESLRLYELSVAITPNHPGALAGLTRARNLEAVLHLVDQGEDFEKDMELPAAQRSFAQAVELDSLWEPAQAGLVRVIQIRKKMEFDLRMTEGFDAIAAADYLAARAAFRVAQRLIPESDEPADGLLQIQQGLQLQEISTLEQEAQALETDEHWDAVVKTYEEILKVDNTLSFANDGLAYAREMRALHGQLDDYIAEPDRLSRQSVMQKATLLVVEVTTRTSIGPRLAAQRDELSRLLKRAVTPLSVPLVSDNVTQVSIHKVGRLGNFTSTEVSLRPGTYVVVGERPGYRDVRQEFRVAPEIDMQTVVVRCEEQI